MMKKVILLVVCYTQLGCQVVESVPDLFTAADYKDRGHPLQSMREAPVIVVGKIIQSTLVNRPVPAREVPQVFIQLTRNVLEVENVVRGSVAKPTIDFYFYALPEDNRVDLGVPTYSPSTGQRAVFYLRPFGDKFRSVGDVVDYTSYVLSGFHKPDTCRVEDECCLGKLLLIPGEGFRPEQFAALLLESYDTTEMICSEKPTLKLLEALSASPYQAVASKAQWLLEGIKKAPHNGDSRR